MTGTPKHVFFIQGTSFLGCDIGGAKEPGVIYFPTNWGAKEPQNLPNHRVVFNQPTQWHYYEGSPSKITIQFSMLGCPVGS